MTRREPVIVVTGLGVCTPLGGSLESTWHALREGRSAIGPVTHLAVREDACRAAALCPAAGEPPPLTKAKHAKYAGRAATCALHALAEAMRAVRLDDVEPLRVAVYGATGQTGLDVEEFFPALSAAWADDPGCDFARVGGRAARLVDPHFSLRTLANGALALVAAEIGARGPSGNYVQGELASAWALHAAARDLEEDRADAAVVFACDSLPHPSTWLAFEQAGLLSRSSPERALRPFDVDRDGLVLGEAGAVMVLETMDRADSRGADALARLVDVRFDQSWGALGSSDATGLGRLVSEMRAAIGGPRLTTARHAHPSIVLVARGLGTVEHDAEEAGVLAKGGPDHTIVTAFKGATGYLGAATGLVEAALAIRMLNERIATPIAHLERPDPSFDLPFARAEVPLAPSGTRALLLSAGWSGEWAATLLSAS